MTAMTRRFRRGIARMIVCSLTACAMPGFTAVGQPPPPPHLVVFADGAEVPGTVTELHDRARATIAGRRLFDPAKPLRLIRLSEAAPRIPKAYVEFDNGDRLPGTVIGHRSEGFEWRELVGAAQPMNHPESLPATLQVVTMEDIVAPDRPLTRPPRDRGITICVDVRRDRVRRIVWRQDAPRKYQPKTLFLADGTASEFRSIRWSDDAVVVLQTNGTAERHPFATINELHLPPRADPWDAWFETLADDEAGVVQAVLRSGARVSFPQRQFLSAAGLNSIFVQPTWSLDPLFLPVPEIVRLLAFAPAEAPLSFLEPSRVRQASPLGTSWIWQADHNVQGGPLDLAGPPISWGCGVQARTELTWPLTTGVREFRCRVGLDRIVAGGGCVRASIHANDAAGPPLWQSEILVGSGSAADCGSLPLAGPDGGQNDLVLVADDAHRDRPPGADPFDIRDCVDWAEPLVLFDPTAVPVRTTARLAFMVPAWTGWTVAADPPGRVRLVSLIDPVLGYHRAGWATVSVAEGGPLRLTRTWQSVRPQDRTLVIAVSGHGPATGPLMLRIDGWEWELVPPGRDGETAVPFVLPLEGRPEGPLTVEIVAPVGQQVQWHGLGLAGPLDEGWFPLEAVQVESSGGTTFQRREDGAILASMPAPNEDAYTIQLKSSHGSIRALRMDALLDPTLTPPHLGPGRGHNHGLFDVTGLTVSVGDPDAAGASLEAVAGYSHPRHPPGFGPLAPVQRIPVPNSYPHWGGAQGMPNVAVLHFREDQPATEELGVKLAFNTGPMSLGCFRFYGSADPGARLPVMAVTTLVREPAPAGAPPKPVVVGKPVEPPPGP